MNKATRQHVPGLTLPSYRRGSEATLESGRCNARRAEHYRQAKPDETAVSENRTKQARRAESSTAWSNGETAVSPADVSRQTLRHLTRRNLRDEDLQRIATGETSILGGVMFPETASALFTAHEEEV